MGKRLTVLSMVFLVSFFSYVVEQTFLQQELSVAV